MFRLNKKLFLTGMILLIVVLLAGATVWLFFIQNKSLRKAVWQAEVNAKPGVTGEGFLSKPASSRLLDSDGDGLVDTEEKELGTDPYKVDTDGDGLFDREEVKIYQTDPLDIDTDDDGALDGEEVKGGNNPKGPGRLLDLKAAIEKLNAN